MKQILIKLSDENFKRLLLSTIETGIVSVNDAFSIEINAALDEYFKSRPVSECVIDASK